MSYDVGHSSPEGDDLVSSEIASAMAFLAPGYLEWRQIEVEFSSPNLLTDYAHALQEQRELYDPESAEVISEQQVLDYLMTLVYLRIAKVRKNVSKFRDYDLWLTIPSFMNVYLKQIGTTIDSSIGVRLDPTFGDYKVLSPAETRTVSNALRRLASHRFEFTDQFPRDLKGSWAFMTLQHLDDKVVSHKPDVHMGLALASSFIKMEQLGSCFTPLVSYGSVNSYKVVINKLVEPRTS